MRMPQDFVDAVNEAVKALNPDAGEMISGSFTLGSDFDKYMLPYHYDQEVDVEGFNRLWEEKRESIKQALVETAVEVERKRMAGTLGEEFSFNDSYRVEQQSQECVP